MKQSYRKSVSLIANFFLTQKLILNFDPEVCNKHSSKSEKNTCTGFVIGVSDTENRLLSSS